MGQIVCGLCSSFKVEQRTIRFFFINPSKTIDGHELDAGSAETSLDRIMRSETNTHGCLKYYLDMATGSPILVENNQLLIKVARSEWTSFVINLLASMDFSIIPKGSLDIETGKIIDYKNTSGAFYVDFSDENGHLQLRANKNHKAYSGKIPQRVDFIPISPGNAADAFMKDEIDMIDPTYYAYKEDIEKILSHFPDARLHQTLNIGLTNLVFTSRPMETSSVEDRISAALAIKDVFLKKTPTIFGAEETDQFFQSFGLGFISSEQHHILSTRLKKSTGKSKHKFTLGLIEKYQEWVSQADFPDYITLKFFKKPPGFLPQSEKPDIYIRSGDSSFDEDISALSYLFSQGTFSLGKEDGAKWIQEYMNISSKEDRIKHLRDLHFEMLSTVKVFPIISRPYVAVTNSKWDLDFPKIYAGSPLWKVWAR
jgi:hypothetical protein